MGNLRNKGGLNGYTDMKAQMVRLQMKNELDY